VDEHRDVWPVRLMCRVLKLPASGYYAWRSRPESQHASSNRVLLEDIRMIHMQSGGTLARRVCMLFCTTVAAMWDERALQD
jgi:putative transposase